MKHQKTILYQKGFLLHSKGRFSGFVFPGREERGLLRITTILILVMFFCFVSSSAEAWSWKGALVGTGVGCVVGIGFGGIMYSQEESPASSDFWKYSGIGTLAFAPVGFLIGGFFGPDDKKKDPDKNQDPIEPLETSAYQPGKKSGFLSLPFPRRYVLHIGILNTEQKEVVR